MESQEDVVVLLIQLRMPNTSPPSGGAPIALKTETASSQQACPQLRNLPKKGVFGKKNGQERGGKTHSGMVRALVMNEAVTPAAAIAHALGVVDAVAAVHATLPATLGYSGLGIRGSEVSKELMGRKNSVPKQGEFRSSGIHGLLTRSAIFWRETSPP